MDIFEILGIFLKIVWKFIGYFLEFFWNFFFKCFVNFSVEFFWRNFFEGIFWELILFLHWNWLVCQDFVFFQDFVSMEKEGQEFRSLEVRRKLIALKKETLNEVWFTALKVMLQFLYSPCRWKAFTVTQSLKSYHPIFGILQFPHFLNSLCLKIFTYILRPIQLISASQSKLDLDFCKLNSNEKNISLSPNTGCRL